MASRLSRSEVEFVFWAILRGLCSWWASVYPDCQKQFCPCECVWWAWSPSPPWNSSTNLLFLPLRLIQLAASPSLPVSLLCLVFVTRVAILDASILFANALLSYSEAVSLYSWFFEVVEAWWLQSACSACLKWAEEPAWSLESTRPHSILCGVEWAKDGYFSGLD